MDFDAVSTEAARNGLIRARLGDDVKICRAK